MIQNDTMSRSGYSLLQICYIFALISIAIRFTNAIYSVLASNATFFDYIINYINYLIYITFIVYLLHVRRLRVNYLFSILFFLYSYGAIITFANSLYPYITFLFRVMDMTYWVCIFEIFYTYARSFGIKRNTTHLFFWLHSILFILYLITYSRAKLLSQYSNVDLVMNSGYYILFAFPIALLVDNKRMNYIVLTTTFFSVIISEKRGAIITYILVFVVWYFYEFKSISLNKKIVRLLGFLALGFIAYYLLTVLTSRYSLSFIDRFNRLISGTDGGSGRDQIWERSLQLIKDEWPLKSLIGRGYDSLNVGNSYNLGFRWAHNDFLQIAIDFGLIGFLLFIIFIYRLLKVHLKMRRNEYLYSSIFLITSIIVIMNCMVSMCFTYPYWVLGAASSWGLVYGEFERELEER